MASPAVGPLVGQSDTNIGVKGVSETGTGVDGVSPHGFGVAGESDTQFGVIGICKANIGVKGVSETGTGVDGVSPHGFGVAGESDTQLGVIGICKANIGVKGVSETGTGVDGVSPQGFGVAGESTTGIGVVAIGGSGVGVSAKGGRLAGLFEGHVQVTGDLRGNHVFTNQLDCSGTVNCFDVNLSNADCAEEFDVAGVEAVEPGTLMSFGIDGTLLPSSEAYDNKVVGVISGAGEYQPGIVLDRKRDGNRVPIALLGKVYCKVDANYSAIEVGDLLTTSPTAGHAMKATDPFKAFGSVIGKALRPKSDGRGMIPVLVALQ